MANFLNLKAFLKFFPSVKAQDDEEPQDPQTILRAKCQEDPHVKSLWDRYGACNDRVNSKSQTSETCIEELVDFVGALDHCVVHDLFKHLK